MSKEVPLKLVNVVPLPMATKVKIERLDDEEDVVACNICAKSFASDVALTNHVRIQHTSIFLKGNPSEWREVLQIKPNKLVSSDVKNEIGSRGIGAVPRKKIKKKELQPITGPFECTQLLNHGDGPVCHQVYNSCCKFSIHVRDDHPKRSRKLNRCQVCEKPLISEDALDPALPYICEICNTAFKDPNDLSDHHMIEHSKPRPYQCDICQKRFTQVGGLQQHLRMHSGDRPFPCTFCPKRFTQKAGLDQHLRIHTNDRPYRCIVCDKTFVQSIHMRTHMRTHTNLSPFQCEICKRGFKQKIQLTKHLKFHMNNATAEQREAYRDILEKNSGSRTQVEQINIEIDPEDVDNSEDCQAVEHILIEEIMDDDCEMYIVNSTDKETWTVKIEDAEN